MISPQFAGTHTLKGLTEATPRNKQIEEARTFADLESTATMLGGFVDKDQLHISKDGRTLTITKPDINLRITSRVYEEDGVIVQKIQTTGDPSLLNMLDPIYRKSLSILASQLNQRVTEKRPNEKATYTFKA